MNICKDTQNASSRNSLATESNPDTRRTEALGMMLDMMEMRMAPTAKFSRAEGAFFDPDNAQHCKAAVDDLLRNHDIGCISRALAMRTKS